MPGIALPFFRIDRMEMLLGKKTVLYGAGMDCDIVLIAVEKEGLSEEIRRELAGMGVPPEKIEWIPPSCAYSWKEG